MVKRYAYSTCICMKSYDRACIFFYKSHFNLPGNLLHPYYCHCRKPQQGNYRQLKKKKYKYTCIKTQMTNNQVHKKLTTSMKQLRKILIKNFLSIVQITHNIKMPFPFKTLESHDCTS